MDEKTFAELLELHIRENGYTNYEAAKEAGIGRVNLQRYLSGARVPGIEVFEAILKALPMSRKEREEFCASYELAADGKDLYYLRHFVREILENAADLCGTEVMQILDGNPENQEKVQIVDGKLAVERFVWSGIAKNMAKRSDGSALLYLPTENFFPGRFLPTYSVGGDSVASKLKIVQMVPLAKRADQAENGFHNLRVLKNLIPLYFQAGSSYETRYYYQDRPDDLGAAAIYPYYAVFEDNVILFSEDMEHAVQIRNEDFAEKYRNRFLMAAGQKNATRKLVTFFENTAELLWYLAEHDMERCEEIERYSVEYQPCFLLAADREITSAVVRMDGAYKNAFLEEALKRADVMRRSARMIHYFTEEGLDEFIENGILTEYPETYLRPLTEHERILVLDRFLKIADQENITIGIIRPDHLHLKRSINVYLSSACGLNMILYDEKQGLRNMIVEEHSIYHAFKTFILRMEEKRDVLSHEETVAVLREKREKLQKRIMN
ncbi:MAG TPA: hypothetical protein DHU73_05840 [Lachnoclostridium sp.]|nr:hypothetical protein [Lachnoclostridium sp.]